MIALLLRLLAAFHIAGRRLIVQRGLALATVLGLTTATAITLSVPLYAEAVYDRALREELGRQVQDESVLRQRSAFDLLFRYSGDYFGPIEWEDVQAVDRYLSSEGARALGLPQRFAVRHFRSDLLRLFASEADAAANLNAPQGWVRLAFMSEVEAHITLVAGHFPAAADPAPESAVEVLISEPFQQEMGLQAGETAWVYHVHGNPSSEQVTAIPIRVAGVWAPTNPDEDYWCCSATALKEMLFVPEATFAERLAPQVTGDLGLAQWHLALDGSSFHVSQAERLVGAITAVGQRVEALLPKTRLDASPLASLKRYQRSAELLTLLLYAFSLPILGLTLAFVSLTVKLSVERQRNELAVLRSRGATMAQVLGMAALEALILAALALALGWPSGLAVAQWIGQARGFLDFGAPATLRVGTSLYALRFGLLAVGLALVAQVLPTLGAAHDTILTYKQARARALQRPWWQRAWLDVLLLIPAAYGFYLLHQQGSLALFLGEEGPADPFHNPLLFLVPALGSLALTLFVLRLLPPVMGVFAWLSAHTRHVGLLLAARQLARSPHFHSPPLLLLILTLSLSVFTASLAQTLEDHLRAQVYYRYGADLHLVEYGESIADSVNPSPSQIRWEFKPVAEHLTVPGVRAATRIGRYPSTYMLRGWEQPATFLGIDEHSFAQVAFWRADFATQRLDALLEALAGTPNGVLVPDNYLALTSLAVGDPVRVTVAAHGRTVPLALTIAGVYDLFPTWYPEDGPLFIGNLDYVYEQAGGPFPYDVWLTTEPGANFEQIVQAVRGLPIQVLNWDAAPPAILEEQLRSERQGLFGLLSVGFLAAALLTVLGFLLHAVFSFQRRYIEMGMLRAIGLSSRQLAALLGWETAFVILSGIAGGTGIGAWISYLFIPHLQVGAYTQSQIPPFVVTIAWPATLQVYALFGLLFVAALVILVALLLRMKIFEAIKLGEAA